MPMDTRELLGVVEANERDALGADNTTISQQRQKALDRYLLRKDKTEQAGRSSVVTSEVQDAVESVLPSMIRVFLSSEEVFKVLPEQEDDEFTADQATDLLNYTFLRDNNGFLNLYTALKDGLLLREGFLKVWWDEEEEVVTDIAEGIDPDQLALLEEDDRVELLEATEHKEQIDPAKAEIDPVTMEPITSRVLFDVKYKRTKNLGGRVHIEPIPPEELIIESDARDYMNPNYMAHVSFKTRSELIANLDQWEGVSAQDIMDLPADSDIDIFQNGEKFNRFQDQETSVDATENSPDRTMQQVRVAEHYIHVDYNGDGVAELRMVTTFGNQNQVLAQNVEIHDNPIVNFSPIVMPHKATGRSLDDLVGPLQEINTAVTRQIMDNLYFTNHNRYKYLKGQVDVNALMSPRPGGGVGVKNMGALEVLPQQPLGNSPFQVLDMTANMMESRTGGAPTGLDADVLNGTATGAVLALSPAEQRTELMAKIFSEGLKRLGAKILDLTCRHQDRKRVIRLRNKWIEVDPRCWNNNMDVSVAVGLGTASKERMVAQLFNLKVLQENAMQIQGGPDGALVSTKQYSNTLRKIAEMSGQTNPDLFFNDVEEGLESAEEQQDPAAAIEQMKLQIEQQKLQLDAQQMQLEAQEAQVEQQLKAAELELKQQELLQKQGEMITDAQQAETKNTIDVAELQLKAQAEQAKIQLDREKLALEAINPNKNIVGEG